MIILQKIKFEIFKIIFHHFKFINTCIILSKKLKTSHKIYYFLKIFLYWDVHNRVFKITIFFLFVFSGCFAYAGNISINNLHKDHKKAASFKESVNKNPFNPYNYECIVNNVPVQINLPQQRTVHFWQVIKNGPNTYIITVTYLNFICGQGNSELSRFRKLILFPFHVFW